jgi:hypothetical protein
VTPSRDAARGYQTGLGLHACFRLFPDAGSGAVRIKSPEAASAPSRGEVARIVAGIVRIAQPVGEIEERTEQSGAVIVHQLDLAGFRILDQAAAAGTGRHPVGQLFVRLLARERRTRVAAQAVIHGLRTNR